ncbi:MAG TPA: Hsp20/alpha crystallin family protein [Anaerolineaceae bacterium]|jgi:HSP20 family protein|nr:Hsp20/alpha crystallin family protein [Anaerolineaceae bacterium]HNS06416.1 Hsp20/alpha crystallin family protein [Anaerolineaceae bacterium]HNW13821.1 Hsp20/alpha crystallin family protein [Anaerolineaceae bacterium]HOE02783.1 Hsp20/alpha crystallin family protein [Anaerolineaceae bacterium]HOQ69454.1 Hsp20/alpha crystallin family protein [Anaerolineaceae bacterium]
MTLYIRTPEMIAESRRRMMRRMLENTFNQERVLSFPLEMKVNENEYTLTALLPGLSTDEINIQFNNGTLSIDGEYQEIRDEKSEYLFSEMPAGKFSRSVEINDPIVSEKISAGMKDGVLTIHLPKAEEAKPKTIKINAK